MTLARSQAAFEPETAAGPAESRFDMKRHFQSMKIQGSGRSIVIGCLCLLVGCAVPGFESGGQHNSIRDSISSRFTGKSRWWRSSEPVEEQEQSTEVSPSHAVQANARSVVRGTPSGVGNSIGSITDSQVVPTGFQQPISASYPNQQGFPPPPNQGYPAQNGIPYYGAGQLPPTNNMQLNLAQPRPDLAYPPPPPGHAASQYSQNGARFSTGSPAQSSTEMPINHQPIHDEFRDEPPATDILPQPAPPANSVGSGQHISEMSHRHQHANVHSPAPALTAGGMGQGHLQGGSTLQGSILNPPPQTATEHALRLQSENYRLAESWNRTRLELDNRIEELAETREIVAQKENELDRARQEAETLRATISRLNAELKLSRQDVEKVHQENEKIRQNEKALLKRIQSTLDNVVFETLSGSNAP